MKKLGLVLGSGGSRGVAHIGFLQALDENGIEPYCISGCSMGSVVGGLYAKGMRPAEMAEITKKLKPSDVIDINPIGFAEKSLLKTNKMHRYLSKLFGKVTFSELNIPFMCNAFDIRTGQTVWFDSGEVEPCVRASSSIPIVFKPVIIGDKQLIDGGVVMRMPIDAVRKMGAEVIVGVDVLGSLKKSYKAQNIVTHALRIIDAVDWAQTSANYEREHYDLLLMPELKDMSQYAIKNLDFAYKKGYELGIENAEKIKSLIA